MYTENVTYSPEVFPGKTPKVFPGKTPKVFSEKHQRFSRKNTKGFLGKNNGFPRRQDVHCFPVSLWKIKTETEMRHQTI